MVFGYQKRPCAAQGHPTSTASIALKYKALKTLAAIGVGLRLSPGERGMHTC